MRIGLVAGEASGDMLGAGLITALRAARPGVQCEGVAGPLMQQAGCDAWEPAESLSVMGLVEPLREIPRLLRLRRDLVRRWLEAPPDVFVGIDAPDFNLGLERKLRSQGIPTVHYVSPSVWAWRQRRVHKIARSADQVLCLLPFEKVFYDAHQVPAVFVGHPLADKVPINTDRIAMRQSLGISAARVVTVMPGSRRSEVARLGPPFVSACAGLAARYGDIAFVTPLASSATRTLFEQHLAEGGMTERFTLLHGRSEAAIIAGDAVLLASGTAALEAALLCRAMVAAYRLAPLTYALARLLRLVKVRHFTLPNQLTREPLVPEFLQGEVVAAALSGAVASLLDDHDRRIAIEYVFASLRDQLARGASEQAAAAVIAQAERGRARP
ncbi:MAG: lipid-A-disaccharide synthase [Woeseia sp.]